MKLQEREGVPEWRAVLDIPQIPLVGENSNNTLDMDPPLIDDGAISGIRTTGLLYYDATILWGINPAGHEIALLGHYAPENDRYHLQLIDQAATVYGEQYGIPRWHCFYSWVDHPLAREGRHMNLPGQLSKILRKRGEVYQTRRPYPTTVDAIERIGAGQALYQHGFAWQKVRAPDGNVKPVRQIGSYNEHMQFHGITF